MASTCIVKDKDMDKKRTQLVKELRGWNPSKLLLLAAIQEAVGPNTWRAFKKCGKKDNGEKKPSKVFQKWAEEWLTGKGKGFAKLSRIASGEDYDKWLRKSVRSFQEYWELNLCESISIGAAFKLVNLLVKRVARELPMKQQKKVFGWLHVPLDKYTLGKVRDIVTLSSERRIPAKATMNFIKCVDDYKSIQNAIRELAEKAGVPAIAFDYIAYNQR
jgi:hypothetical protein